MRISSVRSCTAAAVLGLLAACSSSTSPGPKQHTVELTAAQAQAIAQRLEQIGASNPALGDLADSIAVGIQAGAVVNSIDLTGDLGDGPFYAFGLKRVFEGAPGFGPELNVLAFDNPSDPQNFVLIDVMASSGTPDAAAGSFGTSAGGVVFQVSGDSLLTWDATGGLVSITGHGPNGGCGSYQPPPGITCALETMHISFSITSTVPDVNTSGTGPTASFAGADLAGVVLTFSANSPIQ